MANYADMNYWEKRYLDEKNESFDWLEDYQSLKPLLGKCGISRNSKILIVGCGNSTLSEDLYADGYENIFSIDLSKNVITIMNERKKEMKINCSLNIYLDEVMDARDLKYPNQYFDLIIEKTTIDTLLCMSDPFLNLALMMNEIQRVLKIDCFCLIISFGEPDKRQRKNLQFDIFVFFRKKFVEREIESDNYETHYAYLLKKKEGADKASQEFSEKVFEEMKSIEYDGY